MLSFAVQKNSTKNCIQYMKIQFGSEHNLDDQFLLTSFSWLRKTPTPFVAYFFLKKTNIKRKQENATCNYRQKKTAMPLNL